ncbi:MAG: hypothetical protein HXS44_04380 [Theionarchaea archaeon]|nr:hypothetical protein [Theionarchaea archaeon]
MRILNMRAKKTEMDVYILCLHKFKDDRVIITQEQLDNAGTAIEGSLKAKGYLKGGKEKRGVWHVYRLTLDNTDIGIPEDVTIESTELGYYHHRTIMKFSLKSTKDTDLRMARGKLKKKAEEILNDCVQCQINQLIPCGKMTRDGRIRFLYTYPLIVRKGLEKEEIPFSDYTTTLCFDIVEVGFLGFRQKRHVIRISGPSVILHTKGEISKRLLRDTINAIYQYCLYEEKLRDGSGPFVNILDESIIIKLWEHTINTMGGRPVDIRVNTVARLGLVVIGLYTLRLIMDKWDIIVDLIRNFLNIFR